MDDVVHRLARELAGSMAAAVADDQRVEACREKARAAGFEMRVSLEAVIGVRESVDSECARQGQHASAEPSGAR